jgi:hypothetical protein
MSKVFNKINKILENRFEDKAKAKDIIDTFYKKHKGDYGKIRKEILSNIVNSEYGNYSNSFIEHVWKELNIKFPS